MPDLVALDVARSASQVPFLLKLMMIRQNGQMACRLLLEEIDMLSLPACAWIAQIVGVRCGDKSKQRPDRCGIDSTLVESNSVH